MFHPFDGPIDPPSTCGPWTECAAAEMAAPIRVRSFFGRFALLPQQTEDELAISEARKTSRLGANRFVRCTRSSIER